ncbi:PepSY-associated TM helix [compost metagenome]
MSLQAPARPLAPASVSLRKLAGTTHRLLALALGLLLAVMGLTGAMLSFRAELEHAFAPQLHRVLPGETFLSVQKLRDLAIEERPETTVKTIRLPLNPDRSARVSLTNGEDVLLDPYRGQVLGIQRPELTVMGMVERFHRELWLSTLGNRTVGTAALVLAVLIVTGWILWLPRRVSLLASRLRLPFGQQGRQLTYNLHNTLGFYTAVPLLILALSGASFTFKESVLAFYGALTSSASSVAPPPRVTPVEGAPLALDAGVAQAQARFPQAALSSVFLPKSPRDPLRVVLKQPGETHPLGKTTVFVDPYRGTVLDILDPGEAPTAWRLYYTLNYPLHTGELGGMPLRILNMATSLMPAFLFVTGLLIWLPKRRRP